MDHAVISTASELFEARHYPSVVAVTTDALDEQPENVTLLLLRARAHIALRRDLEAQADLRDIIRIQPQCASAYRLLGVLAARRAEHESAAIFFREALRLDPHDEDAAEWLAIVTSGGATGRRTESTSRPAAAAQKLPAPAAAAGRYPRAATAEPAKRDSGPRFARGTSAPATRPASEPTPRFAAGSSPALTAPAPRASRPSIPELPGFGDYLVAQGILTRDRLRAAQAYQRSMRVHLATAIVTLGLATPQRIEWAAVAHQAELGQR